MELCLGDSAYEMALLGLGEGAGSRSVLDGLVLDPGHATETTAAVDAQGLGRGVNRQAAGPGNGGGRAWGAAPGCCCGGGAAGERRRSCARSRDDQRARCLPQARLPARAPSTPRRIGGGTVGPPRLSGRTTGRRGGAGEGPPLSSCTTRAFALIQGRPWPKRGGIFDFAEYPRPAWLALVGHIVLTPAGADVHFSWRKRS